MALLEILDRESLGDFLSSPHAVLVLAKSDCVACAAWSEELSGFLAALPEGDRLGAVRYGKLLLNQPGLGFFKRTSLWLKDVRDLPFTALYVGGEYSRGFIGGGQTRLLNRLNRTLS